MAVRRRELRGAIEYGQLVHPFVLGFLGGPSSFEICSWVRIFSISSTCPSIVPGLNFSFLPSRIFRKATTSLRSWTMATEPRVDRRTYSPALPPPPATASRARDLAWAFIPWVPRACAKAFRSDWNSGPPNDSPGAGTRINRDSGSGSINRDCMRSSYHRPPDSATHVPVRPNTSSLEFLASSVHRCARRFAFER